MCDDEQTCYVTNFHEKVTEDLLEELFTQVGPVKKVMVLGTEKFKYALVMFDDEDSVLFAVETLDEIRLFGTAISVKPKKGSEQFKKYEILMRNRVPAPVNSRPPPLMPPPSSDYRRDRSRGREHNVYREHREGTHSVRPDNWSQSHVSPSGGRSNEWGRDRSAESYRQNAPPVPGYREPRHHSRRGENERNRGFGGPNPFDRGGRVRGRWE